MVDKLVDKDDKKDDSKNSKLSINNTYNCGKVKRRIHQLDSLRDDT